MQHISIGVECIYGGYKSEVEKLLTLTLNNKHVMSAPNSPSFVSLVTSEENNIDLSSPIIPTVSPQRSDFLESPLVPTNSASPQQLCSPDLLSDIDLELSDSPVIFAPVASTIDPIFKPSENPVNSTTYYFSEETRRYLLQTVESFREKRLFF